MQGIWEKKGLLGFYQGYFGGLSRDVPFRVAQLTSYEVTKSMYLRIKKKGGENSEESENITLSAIDTLYCGAISGSFSAFVTSPFDRIKTLLMTNSGIYGNSVISCSRKIWEQDGFVGFFQGVTPRVIYIAPSVMIFFITYEQLKKWLQTQKWLIPDR